MSQYRWMSAIWSLALLLVVSAGCGESGPSLIPVKGSVTVDGQPAEGVTLLFHGGNSVSSATSDASGDYSIQTDGKPGMLAGTYKVTASWPEKVEATSSMGESPDAPDRLQNRYRDLAKSTISVEVTDSTTELPVIELVTK